MHNAKYDIKALSIYTKASCQSNLLIIFCCFMDFLEQKQFLINKNMVLLPYFIKNDTQTPVQI